MSSEQLESATCASEVDRDRLILDHIPLLQHIVGRMSYDIPGRVQRDVRSERQDEDDGESREHREDAAARPARRGSRSRGGHTVLPSSTASDSRTPSSVR